MMKIRTTKMINLINIESMRMWCEYMPECFTSNLENNEYNDVLAYDRFILHNIKELYSLITEVTGVEVDTNDNSFNIGLVTFEEHDKYIELINRLQLFDIRKEAKLKLTPSEQEECMEFTKNCTFETIDNLANIENFYIKSYTKYLVFNSSESGFLKQLDDEVEKLNEDFRKQQIQMIKTKPSPWSFEFKQKVSID